ncbi:MAG: T9SS type A sorting domain-containing protein, partial [Saprospiraceae bacterium]
QAGDIIKSQTGFAQYVDNTIKWVGNLTQLKPLNGYMLKATQAGTLTYPAQIISNDSAEVRRENPVQTFWTVDATQFEHNMTLIGMFHYTNTNATTANMELGAFVGDEVRGVAEAVYIEGLDAYMFFLTSYANTSGEQLHFKLFDAATGDVEILEEKMTFSPNYHQGSIAEPVPFNLQSTSVTEGNDEQFFEVQPNPFRNETECRLVLPYAQNIVLSISDMNGIVVSDVRVLASEGLNTIAWNGLSNTGSQLSSGVYVVRLKTEKGIMTRKVVLQR